MQDNSGMPILMVKFGVIAFEVSILSRHANALLKKKIIISIKYSASSALLAVKKKFTGSQRSYLK